MLNDLGLSSLAGNWLEALKEASQAHERLTAATAEYNKAKEAQLDIEQQLQDQANIRTRDLYIPLDNGNLVVTRVAPKGYSSYPTQVFLVPLNGIHVVKAKAD